MNDRILKIQQLFKNRFGISLTQQDMYATLVPRLHKQMDDFLLTEISDAETIQMVDFLSKQLHGKSIIPQDEEKKEIPSVKIAKPMKKPTIKN